MSPARTANDRLILFRLKDHQLVDVHTGIGAVVHFAFSVRFEALTCLPNTAPRRLGCRYRIRPEPVRQASFQDPKAGFRER